MPPQVERLDHTASLLPEPVPDHEPNVKCVLVGDGAIGKTSLVVSYTTNGYPTEYVPTAFDNYAVMVTVDNTPIRLQLCDTAGQDDFDSLRPLTYPNTDVFLLCFSVVSPTSFHNITDKWIPEIRAHCPKTPVVLVGTQCDLRNDVKVLIELAKYKEKPLSEQQIEAKRVEVAAAGYIECSALTQINLKEVFDTAILISLDRKGVLSKYCNSFKKNKPRKNKKNLTEKGGVHSPKTSHAASSDSKSKSGWRKFCCFS